MTEARPLKPEDTSERSGEPTYLTAEEVLALYADSIGVTIDAARSHIRDPNLLESSLARPQQSAYYEAADIVRQAATLLWGLVKNHPFHDGNKRVVYVVTRTFLLVNGLDMTAAEDERFELMIGVAQHLGIDEAEAWLRAHLSERGGD